MTQDQMKELAQNFRDNVDKILPDTPYNQNRIKEIKKLNNHIKNKKLIPSYHYVPEVEIYENIPIPDSFLTQRIVRYILDPQNNTIFDANDITKKNF